jgi:hypothetical protein
MSGNVKFNGWINDDGSENYKCRAWVNFNGTGTVAIRASGNVSSITDNGVGDYTVNFTTAMPDANYTVASSAQRLAGGGGVDFMAVTSLNSFTAQTTSALRVSTHVASGSNTDFAVVNVAIFR